MVRSKLDDYVLNVPINVGHSIKERERKSSAVFGHVHLDLVIFARVSDNPVNDSDQKFHCQNFVLVTSGYSRTDGSQINDVIARSLGNEISWVNSFVLYRFALRQILLQNNDDQRYRQEKRQHE